MYTLLRPSRWLTAARRPVSTRRGVAGQSLVEFALALPFLLILLLGLLEVGLLIRSHLSIMYAVREGARVGAAAASAREEWKADAQMLDAVNSNANTEIGNIYFAKIYQSQYDNPVDGSGVPVNKNNYCYSWGEPIVPYWLSSSSTGCSSTGTWVFNYYPGAQAKDSFLAGRTSVVKGTLTVQCNTVVKFETEQLYNRNFDAMCRPVYGAGGGVSANGVAVCFDSNTEINPSIGIHSGSAIPNPPCHNQNFTTASGRPAGMSASTGTGPGTGVTRHTWTGATYTVDPLGGLRCWSSNCQPNGVAVNGVHIRYYHKWLTGFLGLRGTDFDDFSTLRLQPPDLSRLGH